MSTVAFGLLYAHRDCIADARGNEIARPQAGEVDVLINPDFTDIAVGKPKRHVAVIILVYCAGIVIKGRFSLSPVSARVNSIIINAKMRLLLRSLSSIQNQCPL